jgi:hypothetical protein
MINMIFGSQFSFTYYCKVNFHVSAAAFQFILRGQGTSISEQGPHLPLFNSHITFLIHL